MRHDIYDALVVGGGPAGLSAALMLGRCCRSVLVCDAGNPRNAKTTGVHGYLTRDGVLPGEFLAIAREQIQRYDVEVVDGTVMRLSLGDAGFEAVLLDGRTFRGRRILLATGVVDVMPPVEGLDLLYGKSVHHCPYCDAWQHRGKRLGALGVGKAAAELALALKTWSPRVTLLTGGAARLSGGHKRKMAQSGIEVREKQIARLDGESGCLQRVVFADGSSLECDALFFSTSNEQRSDLPDSLGCVRTHKGAVQMSRRCETSVPGVYVAGDAGEDAQFVIVAAAEGAKAAMMINKSLQQEERGSKPQSALSR